MRLPVTNGVRKNFGFVEFKHEVSVPYALRLLDNTILYKQSIRLNSRSQCLHLYCPPLANRLPMKRSTTVRLNDISASLRLMGGNTGRNFSDKSMLPSKKSQKNREDSSHEKDWAKSWSPKNYPSQTEESKGHDLEQYISKDQSKHNDRHDLGSSNHSRRSYQKAPYFNEKHHNRDKNRYDSQSLQRPRHHKFNR